MAVGIGGADPQPWDDVQAAVVAARESVLVLGGPGTGKSACLRGASAEQASRLGPERVLGITHDRAAAQSWQAAAARSVAGVAPRVTTVAALAAAVLAESGEPQLRLLTAPEQEARVRDLLAGSVSTDAGAGGVEWPVEWKAAIATRGFARQLRRAVSHVRRQAWDPEDLARAAAEQSDPAWEAVARFVGEYLQVLDWEGAVDYVEAVLRAVRLAESGRWLGTRAAALIVDDAQDLAPLEVRLLRAVMEPGGQLIAAADPDQSIWSFRGADPAAVSGLARDSTVLVLPKAYRGSAQLRDARADLLGSRWYAGLPPEAAHPHRTPAIAADTSGRLRLLEFDDPAAQSAHVAAILRAARAEGMAWRDMVVLSASPGAGVPELIRGLGRARIPVAVPADDLALAAQPAVATLLAASRLSLAWGRRPLDPETVEHVLSSELGGLTAADLRGLRRWMRTGPDESPADAAGLLADPALRGDLPRTMSHVADRIDSLAARIAAAARAERSGRPPAEILWELWDGPWPRRLRERALQPGAAGIAADRDLDAVMRLFRLAQRAPERWGGTRGLSAFLAEVESQEIAAEPDLQQQSHRDSVAVMSVHRGKGRQWRLVVVTGVQESVFGGSPSAAGLFQLDRLTRHELLPTPAPPARGEERRLLAMALGRSTADVVLCAAGGGEDPPAGMVASLADGWRRVSGLPTSPQTPVELVARLRAAAAVPGSSAGAARSVARLWRPRSAVGPLVPAADVRRWPGVSDWTVAPAPLRSPATPLVLSASALEALVECPRRWFLAREVGATRPSGATTRFGLIVHAAVAALIEAESEGREADPAALLAQLWDPVGYDADWQAAGERDEAAAALQRAIAWLASRGGVVESEVAVDVVVPVIGQSGADGIRLRGSIDALEIGADGTAVVWDFKTKRTRFTKQQVADNVQLATYQVAVAHTRGASDGAGFVQLCLPAGARDPGPLTLQQPRADVADSVTRMAAALDLVRGEVFPATPAAACRTCDFRASCPAQGGSS